MKVGAVTFHLGYSPWFTAQSHAPVNDLTPMRIQRRGREGRGGNGVGRGMLWRLEGVGVGRGGLDVIKPHCTVFKILKEQIKSIF